jgi:hypothetical protein
VTKISKHSLVYWVVIIVVVIYYIKEIIEDWQFWPVFLAIIIGCFVWQYLDDKKKDRRYGKNTTNNFKSEKVAHTEQSEGKLNSNIDSRIIKYLNKEPKVLIVEGKRINQRTNCPAAKQSSIERAKGVIEANDLYEDPSVIPTPYSGPEDYFVHVYLPYYHTGILAYKRGDWDIAEWCWLYVLTLKPEVVSQKLAIMYRKQHRYQDVVDMYIKAINACESPLVSIRERFYQNMVHEFIKAGNKALQYKNIDKSRGIKNYDSPADMQFAASLAQTKKRTS